LTGATRRSTAARPPRSRAAPGTACASGCCTAARSGRRGPGRVGPSPTPAPRCTDPGGCGQLGGESGGWGSATESGVGASSVVAIDPGVEGGESFVVGQPGLGVSELGQQGAVEPLGLAVGPGTAGLGEPAPDAQPGTYRPPVAPNPVDLGVVGQDPQDLHAVLLAEPGHRPVQKPRTGGVTLVGQRLDVGHARVVIDRDV